MKIGYEEILKIIDAGQNEMRDQESHLYWETSIGRRELSYDQKRFVALIKAVNRVLDLGIEVDCNEKK